MTESFFLYNSLTRKREQLIPLEEGKVGIYCCGPTVHDYVHIGNLRAAMFFDLLRRSLRFLGYQVTQVTNITDVDDKIIAKLLNAKKSLNEFTTFYQEAYAQDLKTLGIELPDIMPRATEEIDSMVAIIESLLSKGHAYRSESGDIYFKISSDPNYGALAGLDKAKLKTNADGRLDVRDNYEKEDAADFALWKAWSEKDGNVFWETALGKGRPGWHIECSAMSSKYLGETFDIHCGGVDLIFPHHTNEIAQSECATGKTFAKYWMHNGHLVVNGVKMSKSLNNFFTLNDLLEKEIAPSLLRLELLRVHYNAKLDFRPEEMNDSKQLLSRIKHALSILKDNNSSSEETQEASARSEKTATELLQATKKALADDLNIAEVWSAMSRFLSYVNQPERIHTFTDKRILLKAFREIDKVIGIEALISKEEKSSSVPQEILLLAEQRHEARQAKDFNKADTLRSQIAEAGYDVKDTPTGPVVIKL